MNTIHIQDTELTAFCGKPFEYGDRYHLKSRIFEDTVLTLSTLLGILGILLTLNHSTLLKERLFNATRL